MIIRFFSNKWMRISVAAGLILLPINSVLAENYAIVFSGGVNASNNHDRYYEETLRIWQDLVSCWGYDVNNVYVLFADGTDPAIDRSSGVSSDWSAIVSAGGNICAATTNDFKNVIQTIGSSMVSGSDSFFFWSFDHGSQTDPAVMGSGSLCAWNSQRIYSSEFTTYLDPVLSKTPAWDAYIFTQCYAGDMANSLGITADDTNRFTAWAAAWNEVSYDKGFADAWASGMEAGHTQTQTLGTYAVSNDPYGPNGTQWETPGWVGGLFSMGVPEPGSAVLLLLSWGIVRTTRRKR